MKKEESLRDRYWRLRKELNELYQRQMIDKELERSAKTELDAMEDAIRKGDVIKAYRHQIVLEILLR